jgi:hypothetical protein
MQLDADAEHVGPLALRQLGIVQDESVVVCLPRLPLGLCVESDRTTPLSGHFFHEPDVGFYQCADATRAPWR